MTEISRLKNIYGFDKIMLDYQKERFEKLYKRYSEYFGEAENANYFSAPGRTELSGNHTDHNGGRVIAAAVNLDTIACVTPQNEKVELFSDGFQEKISVDISILDPVENETGTPAALIRGIISGFKQQGYEFGGFRGVVSSDVLVGSGLSSSASFEVLIGEVLNYLYNRDEIPPEIIARIGQKAENIFFGKPCGLMDQTACAVGGVVAIDFADADSPIIQKLSLDLTEYGYKLLVVNTGSSHHNLTGDYAAIPAEMKEVAAFLNKENCSQVDFAEFKNRLPDLFASLSHRSVLRAFHFFRENLRVSEQVKAIRASDFDRFLVLVRQSGDSSFKYLQNIFSGDAINEQPVSVALALTEDFLSGKGAGACRIHGGGFAGTIQVFMPSGFIDEYKKIIEPLYGDGSVRILDIRNIGATVI